MSAFDNRNYYAARECAEISAAEKCDSLEAARAHREMAKLYRQRLEELQNPALPEFELI